ncbi:MAG: ABC-F family ATP-binding cassette domain-containing protein [Thermoleophilia bacterium]|nr:ABC-F family ATP-binding cassette domain-containing protein [Thermoleophilia bacterium]
MSVLRLVDAAIAPASTTTPLLRHVDLSVNAGDRLAIIGPNGSGKSTLLAALAGRASLLDGRRDHAADVRVAFADRGPRTPDVTVELELLAHRPRERSALRALRAASVPGSHDPIALAAAIDLWGELDGWQLEAELARVLDDAGLAGSGVTADRSVATLSGGQRQRVELAALLIADADVVLLDEPTDDLDDDAVAWVERSLLSLDAAVVVASHDRALLEQWPERIASIDRHAQSVRVGAGPLEAFQAAEHERQTRLDREYVASERRSAAAERAAAERAARARTMLRVDYTDGRHTIGQKTHFRGKAGALARGARILRERDERQRVERPWRARQVGAVEVVDRVDRGRSGGLLVMARGLVAGHDGRAACGPIDLEIARGDRITLVGPNGAGKTTMLRTIAGELAPVDGVLDRSTTTIAQLEQRMPEQLLAQTALEVIEERVPVAARARARTVLGSLLVRGRDLQRPTGELSEGSRRKVLLACLLASSADLLLLDEPANHLDLESRDALAAALEQSTSTLVLTTHDRALRERVASRTIAVTPVADAAGER